MDLEKLSKILRSYDANYDTRALENAFRDQSTASALFEWANVHLDPDTLLTADELSQYLALEKSGKAAQLAAPPNRVVIDEQDVRTATEELKHLTKIILKHTDTMKLQQDALDRLVRSSLKEGDSRIQLEFEKSQSWDAECKTLLSTVEHLSQLLDCRIAEVEQQQKDSSSSLQQTLSDLLRFDDKLLSNLQKLGLELETEDPEGDNEAKLREACARLIKYTVEAIRTKLDRIYLESLEAASISTSEYSVSTELTPSLQEELESLYAEILPVAQMSVEQQFLLPTIEELDVRSGNTRVRSEQALDYINDCIDYLLNRVERLSLRIQDFEAYQAAARSLVARARAELAVQVGPNQEKEHVGVPSSPTKRQISSGSYPVRIRTYSTSHCGRRSSVSMTEDSPIEELLRSLALALPSDDHTADTEKSIAFLSDTLLERRAKVADVSRDLQATVEGAVSAEMADVRAALGAVQDSLWGDIPFGRGKLADPEIEGSIGVLTQEVERVKGRLEVAEKASVAREKSFKRDEMIRRWGR